MKATRAPRQIAALMMACVAVFLFAAFLYSDLSTAISEEGQGAPVMLILRYLGAMAVCGAVAGALLAGFFGRRGVLGWVLSIIGGALASVIAGVAGSAVGLLPDLLSDGWHTTDLIAALSGALILPFALADLHAMVFVWLMLILATHLWVKSARN